VSRLTTVKRGLSIPTLAKILYTLYLNRPTSAGVQRIGYRSTQHTREFCYYLYNKQAQLLQR